MTFTFSLYRALAYHSVDFQRNQIKVALAFKEVIHLKIALSLKPL